MQTLKGQFISSLLMVLSLLSAQQARAELIATTGDAKITYLEPLRNGISELSLVWPIDRPTKDRVAALRAGLASVVSGGTSSRSSYKIAEYRQLKGIKHFVETSRHSLMLTVSAPNEVFPETIIHLENLLLEPEYSDGWYARELQHSSSIKSTRTRRPEDVLKEVAHFLEYEPGDAVAEVGDGEFRFGRPIQAILRSGDQEVERRTLRLVNKLPRPKGKWELPFARWADALFGANEEDFTLPKGVIHFADPDSTEMLILFVKAEKFADETEQIGTNVLVDYIGANQGSEMFRIIRQEMRAAYDPRSDFVVMGKKKAIISLSATVEAVRWPEVYEKIRDIYQSVRSGKIEQEGLGIQFSQLDRAYYRDFFTEPVWGARQYLHEYPEGTDGTIEIPLFGVFQSLSLEETAANSNELLPPLEDFLLILIGGGSSPSDILPTKGYCSLPKSTPLRFCLDVLSKAENL
ncbi:hypothetical protein [Ruegeria atlantica]|uniref:hypothetical protein n=1 Tax=Ruegeria atlantica TaxID=81569 RepID=UPI001C2BB439|nr:hypothetical protein [Ruegeria atlantica]